MPANYGFRSEEKYPWFTRKCRHCRKKFLTRNPRKMSCNSKCQIKYWISINGQSREVRQMRRIIKEAEKILKSQ